MDTESHYPLSPIAYRMLPWVVAIAFFMQTLDTTILNTALPSIASDFHEQAFRMQSVIVAYTLTVAILIPLSGYLANKFGTQRLFITAVTLFSLGSLFCALSSSLVNLIISRVIQGIGGAIMMPVARLTLIKVLKRSDFLSAMNFATIPGLIGPILGPLVGGYLVDLVSWHWIFIINIPIGIIGIFCGLKFMPNITEVNDRFDTSGFLLFALAIIFLLIGLEMIDYYLYYCLLFIAISGILLLYYARHTKSTPNAIFPRALFDIRTFRIGILGNLLTRLGMSAIPLLIPLLMQLAFGHSASFSGWMLMPMACAVVFMKTLAIRLLTYFSYRNILIFNTMIVGLIIMSMSFFSFNTPIIYWIVVLFMLGLANSLQFTTMSTISLADLKGKYTSSGNALAAAMQQLSISLGISFGAFILRLFQQQLAPITQNSNTEAFKYCFLVLGIITFLSSFIFTKLHTSDGNNLINKNS